MIGRASNSPALRGSLPPGPAAWALFLPLSRQAFKISHINEKNPAKHVKSPTSVGKIHRKQLPCQFSIQPKKITYTYQFRLKKDVISSIL